MLLRRDAAKSVCHSLSILDTEKGQHTFGEMGTVQYVDIICHKQPTLRLFLSVKKHLQVGM